MTKTSPAAQGTVAVLNAADRMREFMEGADRGMARVPVAHIAEWRKLLSERYRAEVERVNRATDAEIGGIHRSFAPSPEALPAGVEAQGRLRAYLIKQAALCQQRSAAFASRAAGWVEELNHRLDCGYSDGAVDAASRQASEFQRYSAQEYQEAEMFMSGLLGHSAALTSAPAPEDRT